RGATEDRPGRSRRATRGPVLQCAPGRPDTGAARPEEEAAKAMSGGSPRGGEQGQGQASEGRATRQRAAELEAALAATPSLTAAAPVGAEAGRLARGLDALAYFGHPYPATDLQSAGMPPEEVAFVATPGPSLEERWARFAPYWACIRHTGFSQSILEGWRAV